MLVDTVDLIENHFVIQTGKDALKPIQWLEKVFGNRILPGVVSGAGNRENYESRIKHKQ